MAKNNQISREELTRKKGLLQAKYGEELDDGFAMMMNENEEHFKKYISLITSASQQIRDQIKQVNFNNKKEAFWYGLGKALPYSTAIIVLTIAGTILINKSRKYTDLKNFINRYPQFESYRTLVKFGEIEKDETGQEYLILEAPKSNDRITIGKEYQKIKKNKVYIPLIPM